MQQKRVSYISRVYSWRHIPVFHSEYRTKAGPSGTAMAIQIRISAPVTERTGKYPQVWRCRSGKPPIWVSSHKLGSLRLPSSNRQWFQRQGERAVPALRETGNFAKQL
jgi:hypothetical protein